MGEPNERAPIRDLGAHVLKLLEAGDDASSGGDGFEAEFAMLEQLSSDDAYFGDYDSALKPANRPKNRYSNVLPLEGTRVELAPIKGDDDSDYVNANWVSGLVPGSERQYISTQGPLPETVEDFWRMMWETKSNVIVMLTREVENDRIKCSIYWPGGPEDNVGAAFVMGDLRVELAASNLRDDAASAGDDGSSVPPDPPFVRRTFSVTHRSGETREITQFQYREWPDHGLPESAAVFRRVLHTVDEVRAPNTPITVHCSAGIGRSGTFCTVHAMLEKLALELRNGTNPIEFDVLHTILRVRSQRTGMVQTKEQYMFCYKALLEEVQKAGVPDQTPVDPALLH